jgi:hypothetical protein
MDRSRRCRNFQVSERCNNARSYRSKQYGRGGSIDLSYGGKNWNLSRSRTVPSQLDRLIFQPDEKVTIQLPMPNAEGGDIEFGMYNLFVQGPVPLSHLLKLISSTYREYSVGSISSTVDGHTTVVRLDELGNHLYTLVLA